MKNFGKIFCSICLLISSLLILSACVATNSRDKLVSEVALKADVVEGSSISKALGIFESRGFKCTEGTLFSPSRKGMYECLRHRSNLWPWFDCTDRLQFKPSEQNTVTDLQINQPACTEKTKW